MSTATTTTKSREPSLPGSDGLEERAKRLGLWGLLAHLGEIRDEPWVKRLLGFEEAERQKRSLERRIRNARIGRMKPMADFDWSWPREVDREQIDELFQFGFLNDGENVVLIGPNGIGKTMVAKNLAHQALLRGFTARVTTASELLNDLAEKDVGQALTRCLRKYLRPQLLVVDEVGYLSTSGRHADLLFEVVTRRYEQSGKSIVLTTNKPFSEWNQVFPNAGCVVTLIDRLTHRAEIVKLDGESYRLKEARDRAAQKAKDRAEKRKKKKP